MAVPKKMTVLSQMIIVAVKVRLVFLFPITGEILCTTLTVKVFRVLDQDMTARVISRFAVNRVVALENLFTVMARNTNAITA